MLCLLQAFSDSTPLEAVSGTLLSGLYPLLLAAAVFGLLIGLYQSVRDHEASGIAMILGSLMMIGMLTALPTLITAAGGPPVSLAPDFSGLARYGPLLEHGAITLTGFIAAGYVIRHLCRQRARRQQATAEATRSVEQRLLFLNWLEEESLKLQIDSLPGITDQQRFLLERMNWAAQQTFDARQLEETWKELRCALGDSTTATMGR